MKRLDKRRRRATVLILTLWIVLILSLLATTLAYEMQIEMQLTGAHRDEFVAEQLARIGVSRAVVDLRNDSLMDGATDFTRRRQFDALGDVWAGTLGPREIEIELPGEDEVFGTCQIMIVDEESKLSLNGMKPDWRNVMRNLLLLLDVDEDDAKQLADAIWDWKDPDNVPVGGEGDDEGAYYAQFSDDPEEGADGVGRVHPKNGPFHAVEELLEIPGMTAGIFYGYDPKEVADPEFFPPRSIEESRERRPGLRDLVTVRTDRTNLNTAGLECLAALCAYAADDLDAGMSMARRMIEYRQGEDADEIDNNQAFREVSDAANCGECTPTHLTKMNQATVLTTQSQFFTIYSRAQVGRHRERIRSSRSGREADRPLPSARIVAECGRSIITYSGEDLDEWQPPGYRQPASEGEAEKAPITRWFVPVVYFKRWVSY